MPEGSLVSVAAAPIIAAGHPRRPNRRCNGRGVGTIELRELRGRVPWYGVVYNHSISLIAAVLSGVVYIVVAVAWRDCQPSLV